MFERQGVKMGLMARVVVIGGGVIGCAVACRLALDRHRVTLVERDHIGSHASGAAAGLLAPHSESQEAGRATFQDLASRSYALFPELVERLEKETSIELEYREQESLRLEPIRRQDDAGWLDEKECRRLEPELSSGFDGGRVFREAQLTPARFTQALAVLAAMAGAEIREGSPAGSLVAGHGRVEAVRVGTERLAADHFVLAAGPWSAELAAGAGLDVPVQPRRGQLVALAPHRPLLSRIVTREQYYLVPKPDGTIVVGSTEEAVGFDSRATAGGVRLLLEVAMSVLPALEDATLRSAWAGLRPVTPDELPLIGPAAGFDNLLLATGHFRNGILLAPVTAERIAQQLR
jgi:glycine oxidase